MVHKSHPLACIVLAGAMILLPLGAASVVAVERSAAFAQSGSAAVRLHADDR